MSGRKPEEYFKELVLSVSLPLTLTSTLKPILLGQGQALNPFSHKLQLEKNEMS